MGKRHSRYRREKVNDGRRCWRRQDEGCSGITCGGSDSKQEDRDSSLETSRYWYYIESDGDSHVRHSWVRSSEFSVDPKLFNKPRNVYLVRAHLHISFHFILTTALRGRYCSDFTLEERASGKLSNMAQVTQFTGNRRRLWIQACLAHVLCVTPHCTVLLRADERALCCPRRPANLFISEITTWVLSA